MTKPKLESLTEVTLETVTGGTKSNNTSTTSTTSSRLDGLIKDLNSINSAVKDIDTKTKGFDDTQMMMLLMLAMTDRPRRRRW
ncbi:MAG: hypothetical protein AB7O24_13725 [Kofleriaceae bacterium]